jgi:hypothetical protein
MQSRFVDLVTLTPRLDFLFWKTAKKEGVSKILEIDSMHILSCLFEVFSKNKSELLDRITDKCLSNNDLSALLVIAYFKKDDRFLNSIKKVVKQEMLQEMEEALSKLMKNFFDISHWTPVLKILDKSEQDIQPFFCLCALLMMQNKLACYQDFWHLRRIFVKYKMWFNSHPGFAEYH